MLIVRIVLILVCFSALHLYGADPTKVTIYRAVVPSDLSMQSMKFSLDAGVQRGLLLSYLVKKDECTIEKIGEAEIADDKFSLDKMYDVHYFLEGKDGAFTLNTAPQKGGFQLSGTVKAHEGSYLVGFTYKYSYVTARKPLGFGKNLAPDLSVGLPEMSTQSFNAKTNAYVGIPVCIGGGSDPDPKKYVLTFLILE